MTNGTTPERSALDRMIGSYKRLQEKRVAAAAVTEESTPADAAAPPTPPPSGN